MTLGRSVHPSVLEKLKVNHIHSMNHLHEVDKTHKSCFIEFDGFLAIWKVVDLLFLNSRCSSLRRRFLFYMMLVSSLNMELRKLTSRQFLGSAFSPLLKICMDMLLFYSDSTFLKEIWMFFIVIM